MGERRHLDGAALGLDLTQHALDLRVEEDALRRALAEDRLLAVRVGAPAGVGQEVEARILHHDGALQQVGESAADLIHALAVQDELGEPPVDLDRALQAPMLGVDDSFQEWRHQVDELNVRGDGEERNLEAVGLGDHLWRQLAEIGQRPHHQAGAASLSDAGDEADLG